MKPTMRDGILRSGLAALIRLLILAAAGVSAYLLSVSLSGGSAVGCGPGSACDEVLQSPWAYVLGIPVSALALVIDLALLFATFACGPKSTPKQRRGAWEILVPCSVLMLGAALWFVAVQAFVMHRFCPWCMTAHTCGALVTVLLLARVPVTDSRERRDKDPAVPRSSVLKFAGVAILAVALLGIAQTVAPRKTYSVSNVPLATSNSSVLVPTPNLQANASPAVSSSKTNLPASPATAPTNPALSPINTLASIQPGVPTLDVFAGRIHLDLSQVPIWGSPNAPLKLVSLYDYTCHHCRDMHPRVVGLRRTFGDKLTIVSLPVPLDAQCNYLVTRGTPRPQVNACTYAKLGLIVWRARADAIEVFDDWLFGFQNPPPLTDVTNKAVELVGTIPFEAVSRDPWIEQQLRTDIDIYAISAKQFNNGAMPQFIIGTNIVTGTLTAEQLQAVVEPYAQSLPK